MWIRFSNKKISIFIGFLLLFPLRLHASFIESTLGTAVVNDATATYFNPAALTMLNNPQMIALGTAAYFRTNFAGDVTQSATGFTQSGSASTKRNYYLPSLYFAMPATNKLSWGVAVVSNFFSSDLEDNTILRYVQSNNTTQSIDFIPAVGLKLNNYVSLGVGLNFSYAKFVLQPITGFPTLNIADAQSHNDSSARAVGGDIGFLLKPNNTTMIGFNYRSAMTYAFSGKSTFNGTTEVISNEYSFHFWTPARSVVSINQLVSPTLGFIATVQRIQWSIFNTMHIRGVATQVGSQARIVNGDVLYHMRDTWLFTLGTQYRATPKWKLRVAATYNQSPGNPSYQLTTGNSIILGASTSYEINKHFIIDGSYAHAFMQNESIHIANARNIVTGTNKGFRDSVSLKLTYNV